MRYFPSLDQQETLDKINEALQTQLKSQQGKALDPFTARFYEEKGHVLMILAKDGTESDYNLAALKSFNSSLAIIDKTSGGDKSKSPRVDLVISKIHELGQNPLTMQKL